VFDLVAPLRAYRVQEPEAADRRGVVLSTGAAPPAARLPIGMDDPTLRERVERPAAAADAHRPLTYRVMVDEPSAEPVMAASDTVPAAPPEATRLGVEPPGSETATEHPDEGLALPEIEEQPEAARPQAAPRARVVAAAPVAARRGRSFWRSLGRVFVGAVFTGACTGAGYIAKLPPIPRLPELQVDPFLLAGLGAGLGLLLSSILGRWIFGRP
jgi:hypothetical protein